MIYDDRLKCYSVSKEQKGRGISAELHILKCIAWRALLLAPDCSSYLFCSYLKCLLANIRGRLDSYIQIPKLSTCLLAATGPPSDEAGPWLVKCRTFSAFLLRSFWTCVRYSHMKLVFLCTCGSCELTNHRVNETS